jgi:hypothetical protein
MDFLKKNYEKVLLGIVLLGLVVAVVFLVLYVNDQKSEQDRRRTGITTRPVTPLQPPPLAAAEQLLQRGNSRVSLDVSPPHRLFNPLRWGKTPDGRIYKIDAGGEINRLEVTNRRPLKFTVTLDGVSMTESGARYAIGIEQQAGAKPKGKTQEFTSINDRKKKAFTLLDVKGPPDNPTSLDLELAETGEQISISKDKPYSRVDGYMVDIRSPEGRTFANCRVDSRLTLGGNSYKVVAVTQDEVVLLADSNQKKWTKKYSVAP